MMLPIFWRDSCNSSAVATNLFTYDTWYLHCNADCRTLVSHDAGQVDVCLRAVSDVYNLSVCMWLQWISHCIVFLNITTAYRVISTVSLCIVTFKLVVQQESFVVSEQIQSYCSLSGIILHFVLTTIPTLQVISCRSSLTSKPFSHCAFALCAIDV